MEGAESPLEVLSRAATMVQENQQALANSTEDSKHSKQTTKWKRDRKSRLPEYSRKSDPKIPETFDAESSSSPDGSISNGDTNGTNKVPSNDAPLDMTVRQRGLPPSYAQTINNPGYRSSYRPSVIHNGVPPVVPRDELPSGISMCDPIIDEHFRRSLGNDYHTLFSNNNLPKENAGSPPPILPPPVPMKLTTTNSDVVKKKAQTNVIEFMDTTGLSVDDHFAKALGDTWTKLNKKDGGSTELKSNAAKSENNLVTT